ncbi:MAG: hypothetical protein Kow00122_02970 [Thermoleophilia bacterium]
MLLIVLVLCLGAAVVLGTWASVGAVEAGVLDTEREGRARLQAAEDGLTQLAARAQDAWGPETYPLSPQGEGRLAADENADILHGEVRMDAADGAPDLVADLERGRDGLELPRCALAAAELRFAAGRTEAAVIGDGAEGDPVTVRLGSALFSGELVRGSVTVPAAGGWALDEGTLLLLQEAGRGGAASVVSITSSVGGWATLPAGELGRSGERPAIVLVTGGAGLDLSGAGDVYGVVLVDGGDLRFDGATVHGLVMVEGYADAGVSGRIVYSESVRSWARFASLTRVRLVPGSRRE